MTTIFRLPADDHYIIFRLPTDDTIFKLPTDDHYIEVASR